MTTSKLALLLLAGAASAAWPQAQPPVQPASAPSLTWALSEFGSGPMASRLPLLLVRGWDRLPAHRLTDAERAALYQKALDDAAAALRKQMSQLLLDLDKKRIAGPLPAAEPAATQKSLADLEVKLAQTLAGKGVTPPPDTMALKPVWPAGRDGLPWPAADAAFLASQSNSQLAVSGEVTTVGGYLEVAATLYSAIEKKTLASWQGRFAPEEAPQYMAEAADAFREALLGRPWAGLALTSNVGGTRVRWADVWHDLPWSSDDLDPGSGTLLIQPPGLPQQTRGLVLEAGRRLPLAIDLAAEPDSIVLETVPPGASLYLDSRYLGPSPQTVERPLSTARVRAQAPGFETKALEIGPLTPSPSTIILLPPSTPVSVPDAKDRFYWSLAAFSFSLTSSAFLGAWQQEQVNLANQYAVDAPGSQNHVHAVDRYWAVTYAYSGSVVLTSAVFVWMMFELGAYLAADQATLP